MNNNFYKILLYGSILVVVSAIGVLAYNYFYYPHNEETTTTTESIDEIYLAIINGDTDVYRKYIDDGNNLSYAYLDGREKGRTPLEVLIDANDLQYAKKLMDNGFDLTEVDNNHIDTVTSIISYNQDFNIELINDITIELIQQIQDEIENDDSYGYSLLMNVITTDNDLLVTEILKYVENIDQEYNDETALTYACGMGINNLGVIKELVEKGADINLTGKEGYNCLMNSIMSQQNETVSYLLSLQEIDVNAVNDYGQTAMHLCVEYTNIDAIDIFLQNSTIDLTIQDEDGYTPKEYALYMANLYPDVSDYTIIADKL